MRKDCILGKSTESELCGMNSEHEISKLERTGRVMLESKLANAAGGIPALSDKMVIAHDFWNTDKVQSRNCGWRRIQEWR